jgi:integrase
MQTERSSIPRRTRLERGVYWREAASGRRTYEIQFADATGRTRWRTIKGGLREARQARADMISKLGRVERIGPARLTFGQTAEAFLTSPAMTRLRPRTGDLYGAHLRLHILPAFGRRRISELDEDDVLRLLASLEEKGLSAWSRHGVLSVASRVFSYATRRGMIGANPVQRLERGERPTPTPLRERRALTVPEITILLREVPSRYRTLILAALSTGLRISELLALWWMDIDFDEGFVRVRKQLGPDGSRVAPKTARAVRDVTMLPGLSKHLREHKIASAFSKPRDFVFLSETGGPLDRHNVARRALGEKVRAKLDAPGCSRITMHSLRHSFASHLISEGFDPVTVARLLGHSRASLTLDFYSHEFDQARRSREVRDRMAASDFGRVLGK